MSDRVHQTRLKTRRFGGRRRLAILALAALTALLITVPNSAPYVAIAAGIVMIWGIWAHPSDKTKPVDPIRERREPSLWDDGFGQTG